MVEREKGVMQALRSAAICVLAVGAAGGCGDDGPETHDASAARFPETLDERAGALGPLRLGDSVASFERHLGRGQRPSPYSSPVGPINGDLASLGLPYTTDAPAQLSELGGLQLLRYDHASFEATGGAGVFAMYIAVKGVRTAKGVKIGDRLAGVREAYSNAECATRNRDSEYVSYPYCLVRVTQARYLWFGQDPIRSLALASVPMG